MVATAADEEVKVTRWRAERFQSLGFREADAELLALSDVDWHEAAVLIANGCPVYIALRLLT